MVGGRHSQDHMEPHTVAPSFLVISWQAPPVNRGGKGMTCRDKESKLCRYKCCVDI